MSSSPEAVDAVVPVVGEGQGHIQDLRDDALDELDLLVQQTSLVHAAHVARMYRHHKVKVVGIFHFLLELQPCAVQNLGIKWKVR